MSEVTMDHIIYLDNHLMVLHKPAGMLVQRDRTGDESLLDLARAYLKKRFNKPGNVYLGLVHRLDRPVSGVIVFARTSKAAARLSAQFRERRVEKVYRAVVEGEIAAAGELTDRMIRSGATSRIEEGDGGREARLSFRRLLCGHGRSLVEINLGTGRHHQIRLQLAHTGHPIIGDFRYGSKTKFGERAIALQATTLTLFHPTRQERISFSALPDESLEALLQPPAASPC